MCIPDLVQLHRWEKNIQNRIDHVWYIWYLFREPNNYYTTFSDPNYTDELYQDAHVPKDVYLDHKWKHFMNYFQRLFNEEEIQKIKAYRQFFLSKISAVNIDEKYLKED